MVAWSRLARSDERRRARQAPEVDLEADLTPPVLRESSHVHIAYPTLRTKFWRSGGTKNVTGSDNYWSQIHKADQVFPCVPIKHCDES